ncbi:MAG: YncE family protein [Planctomycetes bacterium]|nr:YncE family protein [Planctomycetota bacterium]
MNAAKSNALSRLLTGLALVVPTALAAAVTAPLASAQTAPLDDFKGYWMNYEVGTMNAFAFAPSTGRVYTFNQPGARVLRLANGPFQVQTEIPVGPGTASIAHHPAADELWVVDRVTSTVSVLDTNSGVLVATIPVGAEPHMLVFTASGDRAYVSCSAAGRVDVIDTATRTVVASHEVPSRAPRGLALLGDHVYVTPLLSGNGSVPRGNAQSGRTDDAVTIEFPQPAQGVRALPDRDLYSILVTGQASTDVLQMDRTVRGLGTVLYNLRSRPQSTELWIPHTDALNADFRGEKAFVAGQVTRNRIAIVDTALLGQGDNAAAVSILDLDALIPLEQRASTPTDVAFTSDGQTAFVAGYGSDRVAVLHVDAIGATWMGSIVVTPHAGYPDGSGPRSLAVSPDGQFLYVHNKGENGMVRVPLAQLPTSPGFVYQTTAAQSRELGWDPLPGDINQGRVHFNRTQNSLSNTSSCMTCHVDGHVDGIAWDLGGYLDAEGVQPYQMAFPIDNKGPLVTQSTRRLKEVGPYHWRGEKKSLLDFNGTFTALMERVENGQPQDLGVKFRYITQYMETLAIGPNPRELANRTLTPQEQEGLSLFQLRPVVQGMTCNDCHTLPLGTRGEIADNRSEGLAPSGVVPSLREVGEKSSPRHVVGGPFGVRTEAGIAFGHTGVRTSIEEMIRAHTTPSSSSGPQAPPLSASEIEKITAFLEAFDTGHAPAAATQVTATAANQASFVANVLQPLELQAQHGACDLVFHFGPIDFQGHTVYMSGRYDPASGVWIPASTTLAPLSDADLMAQAAAGRPVTFRGVPPFVGEPFALDRDVDGLYDLDELLAGTNPEDGDTDLDGFFDGYELDWQMNPLVHDNTSPDQAGPALVGGVQVVYVTTNTIKFEFHTDEPSRALFSYNGGPPVLRAPLKPKHGQHFSIVLNELEPSTFYDVQISLTDLAGNVSTPHFGVNTLGFVEPTPAHVTDLNLSLVENANGGPEADLAVRLSMELDAGVPAVGYDMRAVIYYASNDDSVHVDLGPQRILTNVAGRGVLRVSLPTSIPRGQGRLYFAVERVREPAGMPIYAEGDDSLMFQSLAF